MRRCIMTGPIKALVLGSGFLFGLSACYDSATAPGAELAGTFVLATVAGVPLDAAPFLPTPGSFLTEGRFLADTIVFVSDGTGRRTFTSITRELSTGQEYATTLRFAFRHERDGDTVTLDRVTCTPNCSVAPAAIRFSDRGSALESTAGDSDVVFRYLSVSP